MLVRLTDPSSVALSRADVKKDLKIYHSDDDDRIDAMIASEALRYGDFTRRVMAPTDFELRLEGWCGDLRLPANPVREVTEVAYRDADGAEQVLASDQWSLDRSEPETILRFIEGFSGPDLERAALPVMVRFSAGYSYPMPSGLPAYLGLNMLDQINITRMVGALYYEDAPVSEEEMRRTMSGRRLLW